MKVILRAQLVTDWGEVTEVDVAEFSRPARALNADTLGLSLTDGKALLNRLQQTIAGAQAEELCELHRVCQRCHRWNPVKDYRLRKIDTVFGTVSLRSPRIISCPCEPPCYLELPTLPFAPRLRHFFASAPRQNCSCFSPNCVPACLTGVPPVSSVSSYRSVPNSITSHSEIARYA
jgi:hypothetical protein